MPFEIVLTFVVVLLGVAVLAYFIGEWQLKRFGQAQHRSAHENEIPSEGLRTKINRFQMIARIGGRACLITLIVSILCSLVLIVQSVAEFTDQLSGEETVVSAGNKLCYNNNWLQFDHGFSLSQECDSSLLRADRVRNGFVGINTVSGVSKIHIWIIA